MVATEPVTPLDELDPPTLDGILDRIGKDVTKADRLRLIEHYRAVRANWKEAQRLKEAKKG